ncbi:MAG: helix-turn-helix transcriptional regulator [Chloroflexi bacterium]|nr:helix-turn-helix transcriptional regulator [Chloroflexota bacterium]
MSPQTHHAQYQKFLKQLRQARLDAGLTQLEAARLLNKPQSYISKCENGERRVDVVELKVFASIYKKPFEFFLA